MPGRKRIDGGCELWKPLAEQIYKEGYSISETHKKVSEQYPVSGFALKKYLQKQKLTRPVSACFQRKNFNRTCVQCQNSFVAKSPTTLMCDDCAGPDRLKSYTQYRKFVHYDKKFGIDKMAFDEMLRVQNNNCGLCKRKLIQPCLDHCHITGKPRGLLCNKCNLTLGVVEQLGRDAWLQRAKKWIKIDVKFHAHGNDLEKKQG